MIYLLTLHVLGHLCDTPWPSSHSPLLLLIYSAAFWTFPSLWTLLQKTHQACTLWLLARVYSTFSLLSNPTGWLCHLRCFRHERFLDSWVSAQNTLVNIHNLKNTKHKFLRCSVDVQNVLDFRFGFPARGAPSDTWLASWSVSHSSVRGIYHFFQLGYWHWGCCDYTSRSL